MTRYDDAFGTDWGGLDRTAVLGRAYALGVAAACDEPDPEELDRLFAAADTSYDRSMAELAYQEGRAKGGSLRPRMDDDAAVWEALVDEGAVDAGRTDANDEAESLRDDTDDRAGGADGVGDRDPPAPVADQPLFLSRSDLLERTTPDDRAALRLPPFLRGE